MPLGKGDSFKQRRKRWVSLFLKSYFTAIGLCRVKTVTDKHEHAAYHNKH